MRGFGMPWRDSLAGAFFFTPRERSRFPLSGDRDYIAPTSDSHQYDYRAFRMSRIASAFVAITDSIAIIGPLVGRHPMMQ